MTFVGKDWRNATSVVGGGDTSTPLDAAALEDMETRLAAFTSLLQSRLVTDAKEYGALGNGAADDTTTLQAAADAAASGVLRIPPGTYLVSAALVLPDKIVVEGAGMDATIIKVKAGTTMNGHVFQAANRTGVEVRDLQVDLNKSGTTDPAAVTAGAAVGFSASTATGTTNCAVRRVKVLNGYQLGIAITNTDAAANPSEVTVEGCRISGCVKRGIYASSPTGFIARNNYLSGNCTSDSGGGQIQASSGTSNTDVLIEGNRCNSAGTDAHGIAVSFCENIRIIGNRCDSNGSAGTNGWGIVVSEDCKFFTVSANRCKSNRVGGISIDLATAASETIKDAHGVVTGNVCSNAAVSHGIYCQYAKGVAFTGNHCFSNAGTGIMLTNGAQYCTVSANVCRQNSAKGIWITDAGGATADCGEHVVTGNHCMNNTQACLDDATLRSKWSGNESDTTTSIASATSVTIPVEQEYSVITGTTTITNLVANARKIVTLRFSGALTFTDGVNLLLAGNLVTTADDTITLRCDGTNFYEVSRSVN